MIDAQNGTFQLQARTGLAQGNSTTATIFAAGAAKEENTSTIEVRVKEGGEGDSVSNYLITKRFAEHFVHARSEILCNHWKTSSFELSCTY